MLLVLGAEGFLGVALDPSLIFLPLFLGMAVAIGYSVHVMNHFRRGLLAMGNRREAVLGALEETGWPLLFTALTTAAAMLSFVLIPLAPMHWIGLTAAALVLVTWLMVVALLPILLSFGRDRAPGGSSPVPGERRMIGIRDIVALRRNRPRALQEQMPMIPAGRQANRVLRCANLLHEGDGDIQRSRCFENFRMGHDPDETAQHQFRETLCSRGVDHRFQPVTVSPMILHVFPVRIHQRIHIHQYHDGSAMICRSERPLSRSTPGFTPGPETVISRIVSRIALGFARDSRKAFSITRARETLSSTARSLAAMSNCSSRLTVVRMTPLFVR